MNFKYQCFKKPGSSWLEQLLVKRLHLKELASRLVCLSFHGPTKLSLPMPKTAGTAADKKLERNILISICPTFFCGYKH